MYNYFCKYVPVEILNAYGVLGKKLNSVMRDRKNVDNELHRNICAFSRAIFECAIADENPVVLTSCCDSINAIYDAMVSIGNDAYRIDLPGADDECAKLMYLSELKKLIKHLENAGYSFNSPDFFQALFDNSQNDCNAESEPYIAVMGARISDEFHRFLRENLELDIDIVNLTCSGERKLFVSREFSHCIDAGLKNPAVTDSPSDYILHLYVDSIFSQMPCMRMTSSFSRRKLLEDPKLLGIVYNTVSFCDFYGFELSRFKSADIPLLAIETDFSGNDYGQLDTRIQAFLEQLEKNLERVNRMNKRCEFVKKANDETPALYYAGIDSGSTSTNAVVIDGRGDIIAHSSVLTGVDINRSASYAYEQVLKLANINAADIARVVTTGYGRKNLNLNPIDAGVAGNIVADNITEITCHAKGAYHLNNKVRTVIDIGGQDSKIIKLDEKGQVADFLMNDKCAAGTGKFLELMSYSLGMSMDEMVEYGKKSKRQYRIAISSMCSVFAQSEVVSLIAKGESTQDIIDGINLSIAKKTAAMLGKSKNAGAIMMTGGVAKNIGVVDALEHELGVKLEVPEDSEICGALGAALHAANL